MTISTLFKDVSLDDFNVSKRLDKLVENVKLPATTISFDGFVFDKLESQDMEEPMAVTVSPTASGSQLTEHVNAMLKQITVKGKIYRRYTQTSKFDKLTAYTGAKIESVTGFLPNKATPQLQGQFQRAVNAVDIVKSRVDNVVSGGRGFYDEMQALAGGATSERHIERSLTLSELNGKAIEVKIFGQNFAEKKTLFVIKSIRKSFDDNQSFDVISIEMELQEYIQTKSISRIQKVFANKSVDKNLKKAVEKSKNVASEGKSVDKSFLVKQV
jgi:hypothetical protein